MKRRTEEFLFTAREIKVLAVCWAPVLLSVWVARFLGGPEAASWAACVCVLVEMAAVAFVLFRERR